MRQCYFCQHEIDNIDFKNAEVLQKFIDKTYKIKPKKKTGLCAKHQRKLAKAVKRARQLGLLPYEQKVK